MGLDAYLYQFKDLDTEAIVKLSRFSDEPWACGGSMTWPAYRAKLLAKAKELHLPDYVAGDADFGGIRICIPSQKYPGLSVGDWDPFLYSVVTAFLHFSGKDLYYVFPEAEPDLHFIKPDWQRSKARLLELAAKMRKDTNPIDAENRDVWNSYDDNIAYVGVMVETIDYVLSQKHPEQFLLYWST